MGCHVACMAWTIRWLRVQYSLYTLECPKGLAQFFANTVDFHKVYTAIMCVAVGNQISLQIIPDLFFLLRCYPSGEHGDKHCPCLKFVLFRVILNDPSASDKWHCVWNARRCRRFCCPYFIVLQIPLTPPDCSWCHSLIWHAPASFPRKFRMNNLNTAFVTVSLPVLRKQIQVKSNKTCL